MYKILVVGMSSNFGGIEAFILNYYRKINKVKFQIDFITKDKEKIIAEDELIENGSKIFRIPVKREGYSRYNKGLKEFFETHGKTYDAIWINTMGVHNIDLLKYSKKYGIKRRIIHSHASAWKNIPIILFMNEVNKRLLKYYATDYFSCTPEAADYMFKGNLRNQAVVIRNAIDIEKFIFSEELRNQVREKLGWQDKKIIGTIGRISREKNHPFLIDVFYKAWQKDNNLRLVIMGDSSDKNSTLPILQNKIKEYKLEDSIKLLPPQTDLKKWYSSFDVFVLPSIYEGLALVSVEAQVNGLPFVASDNVTKLAKLNDEVSFVSLDNIEGWVNTLIEYSSKARTPKNVAIDNVMNAGLTINEEVEKVEKIFLN